MTGAARLTESLKSATRALHAQAERAGLMRSLLRGEVTPARYALLARNLHAIYLALESSLALAAPPLLPADLARALARAGALATDLEALSGPEWPRLALTPAARAYVARLHRHGQHAAPALLAHAYVRYLGDLSGGRMLRDVVCRSGVATVAFYDFGAREHEVQLAQRLRAALDQHPLSAAQQAQLVDEAVWSFQAHIALFTELQAA